MAINAKIVRALLIIVSLMISSVTVFATTLNRQLVFRGELAASTADTCRGMVVLWPAEGRSAPVPERSSLVPDLVTTLDGECRFEIAAPPGRYYLQGIMRQTPGSAMGPLRPGDLLFTSRSSTGQVVTVSGKSGDQINLGTLAERLRFNGYSDSVETGITGRLLDEQRAPVAGLIVLAYTDRDMHAGLYAVSTVSDEDGRFLLHLEGTAELYLQAKQEVSVGRPREGSLAGIYGGKEPSLIRITPGERLERIDIVVAPYVAAETVEK